MAPNRFHEPKNVLMIDMRSNLIAGTVVLMAGSVLFRLLKSPSNKRPRRWVPVVALMAGPATTVGWCLIDFYLIERQSYTHPGDFMAIAAPMFAVGLFCGVVGAVASWIADR